MVNNSPKHPGSRLAAKLKNGEKVITAEITPPKGAGLKKFLQRADVLSPFVDALNITDCQRALVRMSSLVAAKILIDHGVEPVYQLTCRDRNGIAIQSDLMGAAALGIPNLLCLTGDPVKVGDSPKSKSVFEVEATGLLKMVQCLQQGRDHEGHKMNAPTRFYVGAVVNPTLTAGKGQYDRMARKIESGATFFQTQANYDNDDFAAFLEMARPLGAKIIPGILLLHSLEMAEFIHANIPGIRIPDAVFDRLRQGGPDAAQAGIDYAVESMLRLDDLSDGFHLMSVRAEELLPRVLESYYEKRNASQNRTSFLSR